MDHMKKTAALKGLASLLDGKPYSLGERLAKTLGYKVTPRPRDVLKSVGGGALAGGTTGAAAAVTKLFSDIFQGMRQARRARSSLGTGVRSGLSQYGNDLPATLASILAPAAMGATGSGLTLGARTRAFNKAVTKKHIDNAMIIASLLGPGLLAAKAVREARSQP